MSGSQDRPRTQLPTTFFIFLSLLVSLDKINTVHRYFLQCPRPPSASNSRSFTYLLLSLFNCSTSFSPRLQPSFFAQPLMLRLSFPANKPALRKLYPHPQCFRSFHQTVSIQGIGPKGRGHKEPTFRQVVNAAERRRRKQAGKEGAESEESAEDAIPDYIREALKKIPEPAEDIPEEHEVPEEDGLKTSIAEDDKQAGEEADVPRSKKKGRVPKVPTAEEQYFKEQLLKSPERQQIVLQYLQKGYGGSKRRKAFGDVRRVNIVGEELCGRIPLHFHVVCD